MSLELLAPVIAAALLGILALGVRVQHRRQAELVGRAVGGAAEHEVPQLLYFTGVACAICHAAQRPAVTRLAVGVGDAAVIREIDVAEQPELARRYRVMTLPTTVVLRPDGVVAAVNVGFAGDTVLRAQLVEAGLRLAA